MLLDVDRMPAKIPVIISTVSGSGLSLMDKGGHVDGMTVGGVINRRGQCRTGRASDTMRW